MRTSREPQFRERGDSSLHVPSTKLDVLTIREMQDRKKVERPSASITGRLA